MTGNAVIDVAIGLILMYLLLSLVCTTLNEFISTILSMRSTTLQASMDQLIDDPQLKSAFYDHGLISGAIAASGDKHPSYLSGRTFASALLGSVDPTKPIPVFDDVEEAITHLPDSNIRDLLLSQLTDAQGDLQKLRDGVAVCFDQAMDRVSGIYKRKLKWISLAAAAAITLACNADSIIVANALWNDGPLRDQLVQVSQGVVSKGLPADGNVDAHLQLVEGLSSSLRPLPLGWREKAKVSVPVAATDATKNLSSAQAPDKLPCASLHFFARVLGLVMTAFAVSLGAPFWFDLLGKFVSLRGTGVKPDRTDPAS